MRVETRRMAGEDFEVWRWIQVSGGGEGGGRVMGGRRERMVRGRGGEGQWE